MDATLLAALEGGLTPDALLDIALSVVAVVATLAVMREARVWLDRRTLTQTMHLGPGSILITDGNNGVGYWQVEGVGRMFIRATNANGARRLFRIGRLLSDGVVVLPARLPDDEDEPADTPDMPAA